MKNPIVGARANFIFSKNMRIYLKINIEKPRKKFTLEPSIFWPHRISNDLVFRFLINLWSLNRQKKVHAWFELEKQEKPLQVIIYAGFSKI